MVKITVIYKDNTTRVINSSEEFLTLSKTLLAEKLERMVSDTGKPYNIKAEHQNKEIFNTTYSNNTPSPFVKSKSEPAEKLEAREFRRFYKNKPFKSMLTKVAF